MTHSLHVSDSHLKESPKPGSIEPRIIKRSGHNVSRNDISSAALKVLYRLHKSGYQAFLVGGGVRDAMLELHPKDFDIATNATPEEVRSLFSNCRLIGRRFRLAHVRFGREIIEVATFRAAANHKDDDSAHDIEGRILRDNVYGEIEEDVWRRDFTCNALYFNIADFSIWDYVGGFKDIKRKRIVFIGDPVQRVREDPVRMLRAVRFAGKLNFTIEDSAVKAIREHTALLTNVPAARLFDEFLKLFQSGFAELTFDLLKEYNLFGKLFPATEEELSNDASFLKFIRAALQNTDKRVATGKSVTPMFLLGVFLWVPIKRLAEARCLEEKISESQAISIAAYEIVSQQQRRISIPKRFSVPMREMLALQPRFRVLRGKRAMNFLEHRRFRAAYDFMLLQSKVGQADKTLAKFWTDVQTQTEDERTLSFQMRSKQGQGKNDGQRRRQRRRRRSLQST